MTEIKEGGAPRGEDFDQLCQLCQLPGLVPRCLGCQVSSVKPKTIYHLNRVVLQNEPVFWPEFRDKGPLLPIRVHAEMEHGEMRQWDGH